MGDVGIGGEVQMSGGAWGDGPSGVYRSDLAAAFPEVFAASHEEGSLGVGLADDLVAAVDHRGRRPEDVEFLREFVDGSNGAWTEAASRRFDVSLFRAHLSQPGSVFFAGSNGHGAVAFPTTEMLLNGRAPAGAFATSLRTVVDGWFDGDLAQVPRPRGVTLGDFRRYLDDEALPADYRGAYAIAGALGVVDPDGLMNAWLSDTLKRGEWIQPATLAGDEASTPERGRYLALLGAAVFILDPISPVLLDHAGETLSLPLAARYARAAMRAGFDAETAIGVIADYAGTQPGFFDDALEQGGALLSGGRYELASTALRLAAEHARREGDHELAVYMFMAGGDALKDALSSGFLSSEFARQEALDFYDHALAEIDLLPEEHSVRWAFPPFIDARRAALSKAAAEGGGDPNSGGAGGAPPLEGTPSAPAPAAGASARTFGGVVEEVLGAAAAGASAPSALEPEGGDDLMIAAGVSAAGGADVPLVPLAVGAAATPVAR